MEQVSAIIAAVFRAKNILPTIGLDEEYFESGISSLTIIGLQIDVERALGVTIETRELMGFSTINQWIDAYTNRLLLAAPRTALEEDKNYGSNHK
jgi:acyl carrier protein